MLGTEEGAHFHSLNMRNLGEQFGKTEF